MELTLSSGDLLFRVPIPMTYYIRGQWNRLLWNTVYYKHFAFLDSLGRYGPIYGGTARSSPKLPPSLKALNPINRAPNQFPDEKRTGFL